ncbi:MAG: GEVED domain-containing protein [Bacteroidetes bacterium]|nr:GEVED domain-containing protein [Bacteroidota bacterium]
MKTKIYLLLLLMFSSAQVFAQGSKDYGDAPEGVLAYPATGMIGKFPTCMNVALAGFVRHSNFGAFFLAVDLEQEGNQGLCPGFNPYDKDECFNDNDAGLVIPQPFTINGTTVVPCPASAGQTLGPICDTIKWGSMIDINVTNNMPNMAIGFVNVLIDWSQNGSWGDIENCTHSLAPEHVLLNFPVPNGYTGLLSMLGPPTFISGPNTGFVWARFTISEQMVQPNWKGEGYFEDGESEDYLLYVGDYDYGDAPEGSLAYPSLAVTGQFPTCLNVGTPTSYIRHYINGSYFGPMVDTEQDGNAGFCPLFTPGSYDKDECFQDGDAGLITPASYTITGAVGSETVVPCSAQTKSLGTICQTLNWGTDADINVKGPGFVNVLVDWNQDGKWQDDPLTVCNGSFVPEQVLQDFYVASSVLSPLSSFAPPSFVCGPKNGYVWARFSITDVQVGMHWDGSGTFINGESEDYLLKVDSTVSSIQRMQPGGWLKVTPNPWDGNSYLELFLKKDGVVRIGVADVIGNKVSEGFEQTLSYGYHKIPAESLFSSDQPLSQGLYLFIMTVDGQYAGSEKVVVIR